MYRYMRLRILAADPREFGSTYAREVAFTTDTWRARLTNPHRVTFIALSRPDTNIDFNALSPTERDELYVGITGGIGGFEPDYTSAYVVSVWVAPAGRGKGVGDLLLGAVVRWMEEYRDEESEGGIGGTGERRWEKAYLEVNKENPWAKKLYERAGFVEDGPATHPDEVRMRRSLKGRD